MREKGEENRGPRTKDEGTKDKFSLAAGTIPGVRGVVKGGDGSTCVPTGWGTGEKEGHGSGARSMTVKAGEEIGGFPPNSQDRATCGTPKGRGKHWCKEKTRGKEMDEGLAANALIPVHQERRKKKNRKKKRQWSGVVSRRGTNF